MKRTTLDLARRLVGLKHIEARFDAVEGQLGGIAYRISQLLDKVRNSVGSQSESIESLASQVAHAIDQHRVDHRELLSALSTISDEIDGLPDHENLAQERRTADQNLRNIARAIAANTEWSSSNMLEEYQRVVLYGGEPQIGHVLENADVLTREILTCRTFAANTFFILGFARSGTTVSMELINNSIPSAYVLSEAHFYLPKHIPDFYEWYSGHLRIQNQETGKSWHLPNLIPHRSASWWEHLLALREYYSLVGEKMAFSALHFELVSTDKIQAFFEARFYNAKYLFLFRDPVTTLLSWSKLSNFSSDEVMRREIIAWLRMVQLWANMVRILPSTITLIRDDLGDAATERLASFIGHPFEKGFYLPNWSERPDIPDHFPTLKAYSPELTKVFSMVRSISSAHQPLWKCDRFHLIANDPGIDAEAHASMRNYAKGPISEPYRCADKLIQCLSEPISTSTDEAMR